MDVIEEITVIRKTLEIPIDNTIESDGAFEERLVRSACAWIPTETRQRREIVRPRIGRTHRP
jgi:hypothetical protein